MASLSRDGKGWRILFWDTAGKRRTIRLPRGLDKKGAQAVKLRVETIIAAKLAGTPLPPDLALWLREISDELYDRLVRAALVPPRENRLTVKDLVNFWLCEAQKSQAKPSTLAAMRVGAAKLLELFGDRPAATITMEDALRYRDELLASGLRPATVSRRIQHARHVFREAQRRGLITNNPFEAVRPPSHNPADRRRYVTLEETQQLIEAAPDYLWRLLIALARYAGLRVPSEALSLRWQDVLWDSNRLVIRSPKTERTGKPYRVIPMFPLLKPYLEEAFERAQEGDAFLFPQLWRQRAQGATGWVNCNFRTQFKRIIHNAGLEPWPRLWHNLRASCESDLAQSFPLAVVAKWLGNTPSIALRHYVDPTDAAFQQALCWHPGQPTATPHAESSLEKKPTQAELAMRGKWAEAGRHIREEIAEVTPTAQNETSLPAHRALLKAAATHRMPATEKTISLETAGLCTTGQERGVKPQETTASEQTLDLNLVSQAAGEFAMERATPPDSPTTLNRDERAKAANMNASFSQSDAELAMERAIPTDNPALYDRLAEKRSRAQTPRKSGGSKSGSTVAPSPAPQPTAIERNEAKTAPQLLENRQLMPPLAPHGFSWPTSPLGDGRLERPTSTL